MIYMKSTLSGGFISASGISSIISRTTAAFLATYFIEYYCTFFLYSFSISSVCFFSFTSSASSFVNLGSTIYLILNNTSSGGIKYNGEEGGTFSSNYYLKCKPFGSGNGSLNICVWSILMSTIGLPSLSIINYLLVAIIPR